MSLRAERSNPKPIAYLRWRLPRSFAPTLNRATVSFFVIPAKAGTQGERT